MREPRVRVRPRFVTGLRLIQLDTLDEIVSLVRGKNIYVDDGGSKPLWFSEGSPHKAMPVYRMLSASKLGYKDKRDGYHGWLALADAKPQSVVTESPFQSYPVLGTQRVEIAQAMKANNVDFRSVDPDYAMRLLRQRGSTKKSPHTDPEAVFAIALYAESRLREGDRSLLPRITPEKLLKDYSDVDVRRLELSLALNADRKNGYPDAEEYIARFDQELRNSKLRNALLSIDEQAKAATTLVRVVQFATSRDDATDNMAGLRHNAYRKRKAGNVARSNLLFWLNTGKSNHTKPIIALENIRPLVRATWAIFGK